MRCSTSSVWAIRVSQLPIWEMSWPVKKSRKLRNFSERNVDPPSWAKRPVRGGFVHSLTGPSPTPPSTGAGGGVVGGTSASVPKNG